MARTSKAVAVKAADVNFVVAGTNFQIGREIKEGIGKQSQKPYTYVSGSQAGKDFMVFRTKKEKCIRGQWIKPLVFSADAYVDGVEKGEVVTSISQEGNEYQEVKVEGNLPKGIQVKAFPSKINEGQAIVKITIYPDYFQK